MEQWLGGPLLSTLHSLHATSALAFGLLALASSLFHLGRPHLAFRAVLGLRHSWLSREIVAFGAFAAPATFYAGAVFLSQTFPETTADGGQTASWILWFGWVVSATGMIAVFCSTMIYVFTRRECWSFVRVGMRFLLTSALLGSAAVWLSILVLTLAAPSAALFALVHSCGPTLCWTLVAIALVKLAWEGAIFRHLWLRQMTPLKHSARLMTGDLSNATLARFALGLLGGVILPAILAGEAASLSGGMGLVQFVIVTGLLFVACLAGELLERFLFFSACAAPRMPGGIR
jgi:DMSO reductase anchor subunit